MSVVFQDLPADVCGYYDHATGLIHIDRRLRQRSKMCVHEHELVHKILGHGPAKTMAEQIVREIAVERITARRLITFPDLMGAMAKHTDASTIADSLGVDEDLVYARVMGLSEAEQTFFEVCVRQCIKIGSPLALMARRTSRWAC